MSFYVSVGGQQEGPLPEGTIIQRIHAGELSNAYVCKVGESQWVPIGSHPAFAAALQGGASAAPVPGGPGPTAVTGPSAPAAIPAAKKKPNVLLLVGAGCGGLMVLGLIAVVVIYFVAIRKTDPEDPKLDITASAEGGEVEYVFAFETRPDARVTVSTSGYRRRTFRCTADDDGKCQLEIPVTELSRPGKDGKLALTMRIYHDRWTRSWHSRDPVQMPPAAFKNEWGKLDCYGMSCEFDVKDGDLVLEVESPKPVSVTLEGTSASGTGEVSARAPLAGIAGDVSIKDLVSSRPKGGFDANVSIKNGEKQLFSGVVVVPFAVLSKWLKGAVKNKPFEGFSLGKGDPAPPKPRGILWYRSERSRPSFHHSLVGGGGKLKDADLVATGDIIRRRNISCGRYVNRATGYTTTLKGGFATVEITVRDRRTGKKVASHTFTGRGNPCPERTTSGAYLMMPDTSRIERWLKTQVD